MNRRQDMTEFESVLKESVPDMPDQDIVACVTPFKKAVLRVLAGLALSTITFNFWALNYILPAAGIILMFLGFRLLRRENRWFYGCFIISVVRMVYFFWVLVLGTTIIQIPPFLELGLTIFNLSLIFIQLLCLWCAFRAVLKKAGFTPGAGSVMLLIIWHAIICIMVAFQYSGQVAMWAMLIGYGIIIYSIYKILKELDIAGYSIQAAPVKIADRYVVALVLAVLITGCACGYIFGGSYPMHWQQIDAAQHSGVQHIKRQLCELGFPEYVLNDLSADSITALKGAVKVVSSVDDQPVNDGREVVTKDVIEGRHYTRHSTVYDVKELRVTSVGVKILGEGERWVIFHHFLWTVNPGFYGTESIQLWPAYRSNDAKAWGLCGELSGRVLYDRDGKTYASSYFSLAEETYSSANLFAPGEQSTDVFATFSLPKSGQNQRGYIAYAIDEKLDGYYISSYFNYTHQKSWMQYPAVSAKAKRMSSFFNDAGVFKTVQVMLGIRPDE